jgi:biopolymer transport protein ExbD
VGTATSQRASLWSLRAPPAAAEVSAMKIRRPRRSSGHVELNMVPMIDVVFQLLIFLMVMPSGGEEGYLPTNLPPVGVNPSVLRVVLPINRLRIALRHVEPYEQHRGEAVIVFNGEELSGPAVLRARLRESHQALLATAASGSSESAQAVVDRLSVVIAPDMGVRHGHVVAVFDAAVDAGFKNIQFTVPQ